MAIYRLDLMSETRLGETPTRGMSHESATWTAASFGLSGGDWKVTRRTLQSGRSAGVMVIEVDNGRMQLDILPTRGMGIWKCRRDGETLGWQSPVRGPVHPRWVPIAEPSGFGWLEGFDELLCRCGLRSNGPPVFDPDGRLQFPLHGRIANCPADEVTIELDDVAETISVVGVVSESRFHFYDLQMTSRITLPIGGNSFSWHDQVRNRSARLASIQMLYHLNIGPPILEEGAKLVAPVKVLVPRDVVAVQAGVKAWDTYPRPQNGSQEQVYFMTLHSDENGETEVVLHNRDVSRGIVLQYATNTLPCFTQWRNTPALDDGYVTGIEPGTNFPNPYGHESEQGRVVALPGGAVWEGAATVTWLEGKAGIEDALARVARLQSLGVPELYDSPQKGWCAGL